MTYQNKKVAIIGGGNIARYHIQALKYFGIDISYCASSLNSKTVENFANEHKIKHVFNDPLKLAASHNLWDGLIISASTNSCTELLEIAIPSDKPILVEKPVSNSPKSLEKYARYFPPNVMVGYNRRHYSNIRDAKIFVENNSLIRATMCLPENILDNFSDPYKMVRENSTHGLDLLNYIFGYLNIEYVTLDNIQTPTFGRKALLRSQNNHLISLEMNWKSPSNFELSIDNGNKKLVLCPFENLKIYDGFNIIEASVEYPIKKYEPKLVLEKSVFDNLPGHIKPGFIGQTKEFADLLDGIPFSNSANLTDAYHAQLLADNLLN